MSDIKKERTKTDFYETNYGVALSFVTWLANFRPDFKQLDRPLRILDIAAGRGIWGLAARRVFGSGAFICGIDQYWDHHPKWFNKWVQSDFLEVQPDPDPSKRFDIILHNPPFNVIELIARHAFNFLAYDHNHKESGQPSSVMGLYSRFNFLFSKGRNHGGDSFWEVHPPDRIMALTPRPAHGGYGGGTDNYEYVITCWGLDNLQGRVFDPSLRFDRKLQYPPELKPLELIAMKTAAAERAEAVEKHNDLPPLLKLMAERDPNFVLSSVDDTPQEQ